MRALKYRPAHAGKCRKTVHHLIKSGQIGEGFQGQNFGFFLLHGAIIRLFVGAGNKKGAQWDAFQTTKQAVLLNFVFFKFHMLARYRIIFPHDHFLGHGAGVFLGT